MPQLRSELASLDIVAREMLHDGDSQTKRKDSVLQYESDRAIWSHKLHQRQDAGLKEKIERLARRYAACRGRDDARAQRYLFELTASCYKLFYVTGTDLIDENAHDSEFGSVLLKCIQNYDPKSKNASLVHYVAKSYPYRIRDAAEKLGLKMEMDEQDNVNPMSTKKGKKTIRIESLNSHETGEDHDVRQADNGSIPGARGEAEEDTLVDSIVNPRAASKEGKYLELLTLLHGFLNHREDKNHQKMSKVFYRMAFSERITYAIKTQPRYKNNPSIEIIEHHERDTFDAIERGFFDSFFEISDSVVYAKRILKACKEKMRAGNDPVSESVAKRIEKYEKGTEPLVNLALTVLATYMRELHARYASAIEGLHARVMAYEAGDAKKEQRISWLTTDDYGNYLKETYDVAYKDTNALRASVSAYRKKLNGLEDALG